MASKVAISASSIAILAKLTEAAAYSSAASARCAAAFRLTASFLDATLLLIFASRWLWSAWSFSQSEAAAAFLATTFALNSSCLAFAAALEASRVASTFSLVSFAAASTFFFAFSAWSASSCRISESFFMILSFHFRSAIYSTANAILRLASIFLVAVVVAWRVSDWLVDLGFLRLGLVESPGQRVLWGSLGPGWDCPFGSW